MSRSDDLLRRADVVAWLLAEQATADDEWARAYRTAADAIEAGAVAAAPPLLMSDGVTVSVVPESTLEAIAVARTLACAIADGVYEDRPCLVCGETKHDPDCPVPGWSQRRADGSVR